MTTLYGLGTGPGDPGLITVKALRILQKVPVIAYPASLEGDSLARRIAAPHIPPRRVEVAMRLPFDPDGRADADYDRHAETLAEHLAAERDVAVLCVGDPLFYGSFQYLMTRLAGRFPIEVVPGVCAPTACAAEAGVPLTSRDDSLIVLTATLSEETLRARLDGIEAAAVMKVGRHLGKLVRVLDRLGRLDDAIYVERAGLQNSRILPLARVEDDEVPYFSTVLIGPGIGR